MACELHGGTGKCFLYSYAIELLIWYITVVLFEVCVSGMVSVETDFSGSFY